MSKKYLYLVLIFILSFSGLLAQKTLTLEESKNLALKNNCKSKNSLLEIESAAKTRASAITNYFPNISASGLMFSSKENLMEIETQGGNLPVYDGNPANLMTATQFAYMPASKMGMLKNGTLGSVTAVQPVFAGGRIINGNRLAALGLDVSEFKSRMAKDEISLKTTEQYWLIVSLEEKSRTVEKYEELLKSLLKEVEDAYKSGLILKNDVLKVKLKLNEIFLNKSKLENGKKIAKMAFCQYIGIPYDSSLVLTDDLLISDSPQSYNINKEEALMARTEYSLLKKSIEAEQLMTNMKLGEFLPQAGIGVMGMYEKFDEGKGRTFGMVFGTVSIPISGWWRGSQELQERSIKEKMAENEFTNNSELLILQMEKAWQDLSDAYKQIMLCEESKVQAEENLKVNQDSYKNGLESISDLLEAQALLQQAKDQLTESRTNYKNKLYCYLIVTGRGK